MRTFGILAGFWSTNIGNAFFQLGAQHVLGKLFPNDRHLLLADQPGYAFPKKGNPANAFDIVAATPMDYLVVTGPFLRPEFHEVLLPTMERLAAKGTRFVCLGIGMMAYDDATVAACRKSLERLPIDVFTTRDRPTYDRFRDIAPVTHDGIDLAFYVNELWDSAARIAEDYVVLNFDQTPEPSFLEVAAGTAGSIAVGSKHYVLVFPSGRQRFAEKGAPFQILERMLAKGQRPLELGGRMVLRTDHRYNPVLPRKIFAYPNTVSLDIPWPYLQVYANADLVLSNRVHACVAALSFGRPAMLFSKTPRAFLLERVGAGGIKEAPVTIDLGQIDREKQALESAISGALA